jgi:Raf kinase inhibitor-like YbhB/YbcL family protein
MRTNLKQSLLVAAFLSILGVGNAAIPQGAMAQAPPAPPSKFKLTSPAYAEGTMIPTQYTCAVPNPVSPALQWSNPPAATVSFAMILHDTEGAHAKGTMDTTHWIFWNVPANSVSLAENVKLDSSPNGMVQGKNAPGVNGYLPPCPPPGATPHHYVFEMYALDTKLDISPASTRTDLLNAMEGHIVGKAVYFGMFGR